MMSLKKRRRNFARLISMVLVKRKSFWLCISAISLIIYYILANVSVSKWLTVKATGTSRGVKHGTIPSSIQNYRIITITGRSYESKISHLKVYKCNGNKSVAPVLRPKESSIRWNNFWQNPTGTGLFLYSAFYDTRVRRAYRDRHCFVRILAMHDGGSFGPYYCQLWMRNGTIGPLVIDAEFTEIWVSEWDSNTKHSYYKPYIISCTLPRKFGRLNMISPIFTSITTRPCANATTLLRTDVPSNGIGKVSKKNDSSKAVPTFVICVKPLDFDSDVSEELVEWIELNFLLGVGTIDMYKFRVHPNVDKVLRYYEKSRKVRIIDMSLPGNQPNFPVERSQFLKRNSWQKRRNELIPYNDCFYRNMYAYDYVVPLDIDELLVPKVHRTWQELFAELQTSDPKILNSYASFSVRNAYFLKSFTDDADNVDVSPRHNLSDLLFMRYNYRSANFSKPYESTKSFVRTDNTLTVFNHYTLETVIPGVGRSTNLPLNLIQMNHYRSKCPTGMSKQCRENFLKYVVKDTILKKYEHDLQKKVRHLKAIINDKNHN